MQGSNNTILIKIFRSTGLFLFGLLLLYFFRISIAEYGLRFMVLAFDSPLSKANLGDIYQARANDIQNQANAYYQDAFKNYLDRFEKSSIQLERAEAAFVIGMFFRCGKGAIKKDKERAIFWLGRARQLGFESFVDEQFKALNQDEQNAGCHELTLK
ncbi:MAG: hypothetical protein ACKOAD_03300 [Gammaproteobacteria bacterium]